MFCPVLAAPNEPVLSASADGAALHLFFSLFFHVATYNITAEGILLFFEVKVRGDTSSCLCESATCKKSGNQKTWKIGAPLLFVYV